MPVAIHFKDMQTPTNTGIYCGIITRVESLVPEMSSCHLPAAWRGDRSRVYQEGAAMHALVSTFCPLRSVHRKQAFLVQIIEANVCAPEWPR